MATVIGVRFRNAGKLYYFSPENLWPTAGDAVIVETSRGIEFGETVTGIQEISDECITPPLRNVIRIATPEDVIKHKENEEKEKVALSACQDKVEEHKLPMKLVGCEYTFDNSKVLFYFTSDKRVDFRALVKDLASIFRTRIELRQIGVRDEAKMMGGLGICGRPVCCAQFLGDFEPVSIKMAKEQNLSLNPTKISGVCGRLMCCLKYEEDYYETTRKKMPRVGREVSTADGVGMVVDINVLKETVRVRIPKGDSTEQKDYHMDDVKRLNVPQPKPVKVKTTNGDDDKEAVQVLENTQKSFAESSTEDLDELLELDKLNHLEDTLSKEEAEDLASLDETTPVAKPKEKKVNPWVVPKEFRPKN